MWGRLLFLSMRSRGHRLSSWSPWAVQLPDSMCDLSSLTRDGARASPASEGRFLTTGPPEKSPGICILIRETAMGCASWLFWRTGSVLSAVWIFWGRGEGRATSRYFAGVKSIEFCRISIFQTRSLQHLQPQEWAPLFPWVGTAWILKHCTIYSEEVFEEGVGARPQDSNLEYSGKAACPIQHGWSIMSAFTLSMCALCTDTKYTMPPKRGKTFRMEFFCLGL